MSYDNVVEPKKKKFALTDLIDAISRNPKHVTHLPDGWDLLLAQYRHWYKGVPI